MGIQVYTPPPQQADHSIKTHILSPAVAGTEFSHTLSDQTVKFTLQVQGTAKLQWTFVAGESGTKFFTVFAGNVYDSPIVQVQGKTIYMQLDEGSKVVEIEEWTAG